ncbi:MAG TPA: GNAT family N-acetyltransferase [Terracidiphilus sp.]
MAATQRVTVGLIRKNELAEADRILRVAFGTFVGLAKPAEFMGDRDLLICRWHGPHVEVLAARQDGRLIGTNVVTQWGSFGFLGPLTILPEFWDRGVAQFLLQATEKIFEKMGVKRTGLFTFAASAKHVGLYQKFGYWPGYLTALMAHSPKADAQQTTRGTTAVHLSTLRKSGREEAISACARLTSRIEKGLDLSAEIRALLKQKLGEVILTYTRHALDGFAICQHGPGSEGGTKICYIKFAAVRSGTGAGERFDRLLEACDEFALARGASLEAGMNLAREDAYRRMRSHGYRAFAQGVSMQRPHVAGHNRADAYVIDDWR